MQTDAQSGLPSRRRAAVQLDTMERHGEKVRSVRGKSVVADRTDWIFLDFWT
jgi:hypothetical protein